MSVNRALARGITWLIDSLYRKPISALVPHESFRYLTCGVMNYFVLDAILYYIIYHYIICEAYINIVVVTISPHVASMIILFPITFLTGFWLNRYVAFQATGDRARRQMARYALSIGGSFIISYLSLKLLVEWGGIWPTPAKVLASIVTTFYSYMMAKFFTFKKGTGLGACANRK